MSNKRAAISLTGTPSKRPKASRTGGQKRKQLNAFQLRMLGDAIKKAGKQKQQASLCGGSCTGDSAEDCECKSKDKIRPNVSYYDYSPEAEYSVVECNGKKKRRPVVDDGVEGTMTQQDACHSPTHNLNADSTSSIDGY